MTEDTRKALLAIAPVAKELNIEVLAGEKCIFCNGQAIGISYNSTYATLLEVLGYLTHVLADAKGTKVPDAFGKRLRRYWVSEPEIIDSFFPKKENVRSVLGFVQVKDVDLTGSNAGYCFEILSFNSIEQLDDDRYYIVYNCNTQERLSSSPFSMEKARETLVRLRPGTRAFPIYYPKTLYLEGKGGV